MKKSISKIFKRTFQTILYLVTIIMLFNCSKNVTLYLHQTDRFIEGKIIDSYEFEVSNAEIYFPYSDIVHHTDETGYFKIILPEEYELKYILIIDKYTDPNTKFSLPVDENQMNYLKLEDFYRITKSIFDPPEPFCGLPINQDDVKFQVVYEYSFDTSTQLDESWFEENGKPVQNATIKIVGTKNIHTSNEDGEIWVDMNKIKIGDVLIVEEEVGTQSQVYISDEILKNKVIPFNVSVNID